MYPQRATQAGTWGELSGWYEICPGEPLPLGSFPFSPPPRRLPRGPAAHQMSPPNPLPPPHPGHMLPVESCVLTAQSHRADIP